MTVFKISDGKRIDVSINSDVCLYRAPEGMAGIDIYAHKAPSGTMYYYTYAWSTTHPPVYSIITPAEVQDLLIRRASLPVYGRLTDDDVKLAEQHFPGIFK